MNENVIKVLKECTWDIATCTADGTPNVVPVGFKDVEEDGKLSVGCVFLATTRSNLEANDKIAISAFNPATAEGYQIKGTAKFVTEGAVVDKYNALCDATFKGAVKACGALVITPEKVIVTTPGPDNKKEL